MKAVCKNTCFDSTKGIKFEEGDEYDISKEDRERFKATGFDKHFTFFPKKKEVFVAETSVVEERKAVK